MKCSERFTSLLPRQTCSFQSQLNFLGSIRMRSIVQATDIFSMHSCFGYSSARAAEVRLDCSSSHWVFGARAGLRKNPSLQVKFYPRYISMHVKNTVTNISDYARNIDIILDPIRGETLLMGYDIYAKKDDFWATSPQGEYIQHSTISVTVCSRVPISNTPGRSEEIEAKHVSQAYTRRRGSGSNPRPLHHESNALTVRQPCS